MGKDENGIDRGPSYEREGGRMPSDAEIADMEERKALRARGEKGELPAAYRAMIGKPPQCRPGDHTAARAHLDKILRAIDKGGWTRSEWSRLCKLRDKWQERADGKSPRFEAMGNRTGGMTEAQRRVWESHATPSLARKMIDDINRIARSRR